MRVASVRSITLFVLALATTNAELVHAEPLRCKAAVAKAIAGFVQARTVALQKCRESVVKNKLPANTECTQHSADALGTIAAKLQKNIDKACGGSDKRCGGSTTGEDGAASIGFPHVCPNFENGNCNNPIAANDCSGIITCILCIGEAAVDQAIDLSYDALKPTDPSSDKALNKCQVAVGKAAAGLSKSISKTLAKCWGSVVTGKSSPPCSTVGNTTVGKAIDKASGAIFKACGGKDKLPGGVGSNADFDPVGQIGFVATCLDVDPAGPSTPCARPIVTLEDLTACVACVMEFKIDCTARLNGPMVGAGYPVECNLGDPSVPTPTATPSTTPTAVVVTPSPSPTRSPTPTPTLTPTCAVATQSCASQSCCAGLTCPVIGQTCCVPNQGSCSASGQCCTGICSGSICCQANDSPVFCLANTDCCSGRCVQNAPPSFGSFCRACIPNGSATACSTNDDCCSGFPGCNPTVHRCCGSAGILCGSDNDCCSGSCPAVPPPGLRTCAG